MCDKRKWLAVSKSPLLRLDLWTETHLEKWVDPSECQLRQDVALPLGRNSVVLVEQRGWFGMKAKETHGSEQ